MPVEEPADTTGGAVTELEDEDDRAGGVVLDEGSEAILIALCNPLEPGGMDAAAFEKTTLDKVLGEDDDRSDDEMSVELVELESDALEPLDEAGVAEASPVLPP